jgi:hypothetical protein
MEKNFEVTVEIRRRSGGEVSESEAKELMLSYMKFIGKCGCGGHHGKDDADIQTVKIVEK